MPDYEQWLDDLREIARAKLYNEKLKEHIQELREKARLVILRDIFR